MPTLRSSRGCSASARSIRWRRRSADLGIARGTRATLAGRRYRARHGRSGCRPHWPRNQIPPRQSQFQAARCRDQGYLLRCFSSSYLDDLKCEKIRYNQAYEHINSYTYEDIQDIQDPMSSPDVMRGCNMEEGDVILMEKKAGRLIKYCYLVLFFMS